MAFALQKHTIGAASSAFGSDVIRGYLDSVQYTKSTTSPYTAGATLAVTVTSRGEGEEHSQIVLTGISLDASFIKRPRVPTHDDLGVVLAGPGESTRVLLLDSKITLTVTLGGGSINIGDFLVGIER